MAERGNAHFHIRIQPVFVLNRRQREEDIAKSQILNGEATEFRNRNPIAFDESAVVAIEIARRDGDVLRHDDFGMTPRNCIVVGNAVFQDDIRRLLKSSC